MNQLKFNGIVISGQGNGKKFLELSWVKQQIQEKLGYTAYPGTLNVKLLEKDISQRKKLYEKNGILIYPAEGYCFGAVFKATINNLECAVVIPLVKEYPENILEVIAPIFLREALKLKDKDQVVVTVNV